MRLARWWKLYEAEQLERERQAQYQAELSELKTGMAKLEREIDELRARITGKRAAHKRSERETLTYLPAWRGNDYAEGLTAGEYLRYDLAEAFACVSKRMEIMREILPKLGIETFYLDCDHDFATKLFLVDRIYHVPCEGIFAEGGWTEEGLRLKPFFQGISPSGIEYSKKHPPSQTLVVAGKRHFEEIMECCEPVDSMAVLGAVCIKEPPTFDYYDPEHLEAIKAAMLEA